MLLHCDLLKHWVFYFLEEGDGKSLCQHYHCVNFSYKIVVVAPVLGVQGFVVTELFAVGCKCCFCI